MKRENVSPNYTTEWRDIFRIRYLIGHTKGKVTVVFNISMQGNKQKNIETR